MKKIPFILFVLLTYFASIANAANTLHIVYIDWNSDILRDDIIAQLNEYQRNNISSDDHFIGLISLPRQTVYTSYSKFNNYLHEISGQNFRSLRAKESFKLIDDAISELGQEKETIDASKGTFQLQTSTYDRINIVIIDDLNNSQHQNEVEEMLHLLSLVNHWCNDTYELTLFSIDVATNSLEEHSNSICK